MMRVRMITTAAGPGGVWPAGSVVGVDREQARVLIEFGYAVAVDTPPAEVIETATADPVIEVADAPAQAPRRRRTAKRTE